MGGARDADRGVGRGRESAGGGTLLRLLNRHGLVQVIDDPQIQGDPTSRLKPLVDLDLESSDIPPGE